MGGWSKPRSRCKAEPDVVIGMLLKKDFPSGKEGISWLIATRVSITLFLFSWIAWFRLVRGTNFEVGVISF